MVAAGVIPPSPPLSDLSDSDLIQLLDPITFHPGTVPSVFTNWATTFRSQTQATFTPRSVDQVRWIVELARRLGKELRAAGAGHSPSDIVCTAGYVIDLKGVNQLIEVSFRFKLVFERSFEIATSFRETDLCFDSSST